MRLLFILISFVLPDSGWGRSIRLRNVAGTLGAYRKDRANLQAAPCCKHCFALPTTILLLGPNAPPSRILNRIKSRSPRRLKEGMRPNHHKFAEKTVPNLYFSQRRFASLTISMLQFIHFCSFIFQWIFYRNAVMTLPTTIKAKPDRVNFISLGVLLSWSMNRPPKVDTTTFIWVITNDVATPTSFAAKM